jgi:hypothetical protein
MSGMSYLYRRHGASSTFGSTWCRVYRKRIWHRMSLLVVIMPGEGFRICEQRAAESNGDHSRKGRSLRAVRSGQLTNSRALSAGAGRSAARGLNARAWVCEYSRSWVASRDKDIGLGFGVLAQSHAAVLAGEQGRTACHLAQVAHDPILVVYSARTDM